MKAALIFGAVSLWLGIPSALAQSLPQSSFQVSATVTEGCLVDGNQSGTHAGELGQLDFGTASTLSDAVQMAAIIQTGSMRLDCTPGTTLKMRIDGGLHAAGGLRQLEHDNGDAALAYRLFADAGLQQAIGINEVISFTVDESSTTVALPVYGRLALPGNVPAGDYTDRLTVTLEW